MSPWCDSVIIDDGWLLTLVNNGSVYSVGENIVLSMTEDTSATESPDGPTLDSRSSVDKSLSWFDFVVSMDNDGSIECKRISSDGGTAEGLLGVVESKIPVELENGKVWQPSVESGDGDFYLHQRAFPRAWGAGMQ